MKVLVHEWVTGGGMAGLDLPGGWAAEGRSMRLAIASDFHAVAGVRVVMTLDARFSDDPAPCDRVIVPRGQEESTLRRLASACDYTVLIAPETGGVLRDLTELVEEAGGASLGSTPEAVGLTADKKRLADHFHQCGIPSPPAERILSPSELPRRSPYPAVLKPAEGAGAQETYYLEGPESGRSLAPFACEMILQPFRAGIPMSATFLVGRSGGVRLIGVGWQEIAIDEGVISYRGGRMPAPSSFSGRETFAAVRSVGGLRGVCGVDFVREPATGSVTVIEVNPRPTTSYVGLTRLLSPGTIAGAWIESIRTGPVDDDRRGMIDPAPGRTIRFAPDGTTGPGGDAVRGELD